MDNRADREKEIYDRGELRREKFAGMLSHLQAGPARRRRLQRIASLMRTEGKDVLEIGSTEFFANWVDFTHPPRSLTCTNISQAELDLGVAKSRQLGLEGITFRLMDAHRLDLPDSSMDIVFGMAVLHHLELERALSEIRRVLRPGGFMLFMEPLGGNPVGKIIRKLTPAARTPDERPLGPADMKLLKTHFDMHFDYYHLLYVPAGLISRLVFQSPDNPLLGCADALDSFLSRLPLVRRLFRLVLLHGVKR
jgi:SAM-dependent methyltransferase